MKLQRRHVTQLKYNESTIKYLFLTILLMCGENKKEKGKGKKKEEESARLLSFTQKNHKVIFFLLTNKFFDYLNSDWVMKFTG